MASLKDYFEKNRHKSKYKIGDRVSGLFKKVRFMGTVGNESVVSEKEGALVSVILDLPFKVDDKVYSVVRVKPKELKYLKEF